MTPLVVAGLTTGGIGTMAASALVLRSLPERRGGLWLAALAGIPLGAILTLGGVAALDPLGPLRAVVDLAGPAVLGLGALVVAALFVSFSRGGRGES